MRQWGWAALAVLTLIGGHLHEAGAGSKWWKRGCGGCGGCYAPAGCSSPYVGCSSPYSYGCSGGYGCAGGYGCGGGYGCAGGYGPAYGAPMGYQPTYGLPNAYYGNGVYVPPVATSAYGCGGCAGAGYGYAAGYRPEYSPYVYQPNPYANTWGVGAPIYPSPVYQQGAAVHPAYNYGGAPLMSAYNAPVAPSIPAIPALPPADIGW